MIYPLKHSSCLSELLRFTLVSVRISWLLVHSIKLSYLIYLLIYLLSGLGLGLTSKATCLGLTLISKITGLRADLENAGLEPILRDFPYGR